MNADRAELVKITSRVTDNTSIMWTRRGLNKNSFESSLEVCLANDFLTESNLFTPTEGGARGGLVTVYKEFESASFILSDVKFSNPFA